MLISAVPNCPVFVFEVNVFFWKPLNKDETLLEKRDTLTVGEDLLSLNQFQKHKKPQT